RHRRRLRPSGKIERGEESQWGRDAQRRLAEETHAIRLFRARLADGAARAVGTAAIGVGLLSVLDSVVAAGLAAGAVRAQHARAIVVRPAGISVAAGRTGGAATVHGGLVSVLDS